MTITDLVFSFEEDSVTYYLQKINKPINEIKINDVRIATKHSDSKTFYFQMKDQVFG